jgi:hypothetical protein
VFCLVAVGYCLQHLRAQWLASAAVDIGPDWRHSGGTWIHSGSFGMTSPSDSVVQSDGVDLVLTSSVFELNMAEQQVSVAKGRQGSSPETRTTLTLDGMSFYANFARNCATT